MKFYHIALLQEAHIELVNVRPVRRWCREHGLQIFLGLSLLDAWDEGLVDITHPSANRRPTCGVTIFMTD